MRIEIPSRTQKPAPAPHHSFQKASYRYDAQPALISLLGVVMMRYISKLTAIPALPTERRMIDLLSESQIEIKFVGSARAFGTRRFRGVANIDHDAKIWTPAAPRARFRGAVGRIGTDGAHQQHG
jgi:hypothetical protein